MKSCCHADEKSFNSTVHCYGSSFVNRHGKSTEGTVLSAASSVTVRGDNKTQFDAAQAGTGRSGGETVASSREDATFLLANLMLSRTGWGFVRPLPSHRDNHLPTAVASEHSYLAKFFQDPQRETNTVSITPPGSAP